jgi:hypothetical protein
MKKLLVLFIFTAVLFSAKSFSQTVYWTEGFDSTAFPSGSTSTTTPTEVIMPNGTWILYWSFRTNSSTGNPIGTSDLRLVKTATVTSGGFCYVITPIVANGVSKISFYEGRGSRLLNIDKSTDGGQTWIYVDTVRTVAKTQSPVNINDSKANRIRISDQSTSDADIDELSIYKYTGTGAVKRDGLPVEFVLDQNYPNPFNPSTTITFGLTESSRAKLSVYNLIGQEVAILVDGFLPAGYHEVNFKGDNLPSGVYVYRLATPNQTLTKKMILSK